MSKAAWMLLIAALISAISVWKVATFLLNMIFWQFPRNVIVPKDFPTSKRTVMWYTKFRKWSFLFFFLINAEEFSYFSDLRRMQITWFPGNVWVAVLILLSRQLPGPCRVSTTAGGWCYFLAGLSPAFHPPQSRPVSKHSRSVSCCQINYNDSNSATLWHCWV